MKQSEDKHKKQTPATKGVRPDVRTSVAAFRESIDVIRINVDGVTKEVRENRFTNGAWKVAKRRASVYRATWRLT